MLYKVIFCVDLNVAVSLEDYIANCVTVTKGTVTKGSAVASSTASGAVTFNGLVLNGQSGASFNFNLPIDLAKSYFTSASDYEPFIKFAFTPELAKSGSDIIPELGTMMITLTDTTDSNVTVKYVIKNNGLYDKPNQIMAMIGVRGAGQDNGCERNGGLNEVAPMKLGIAGTAAATNNLIYDFDSDKTYFQPDDGRGVSTSGEVGTLIRDLKKSYTSGTATNKDKVFAGFKSNMVTVSISFPALYSGKTSATLVVTKLGDLDFTKDNIVVVL